MVGNNKQSMVEAGKVERLGRMEDESQGRTFPEDLNFYGWLHRERENKRMI